MLFQRVTRGKIVADEGGVDGAVDDDMGHMDAARPELARHALRQRAQRVLGAGKRREIGRAAQRRRGAGEQNRALAAVARARNHALGGLAAVQESAHAGHLPNLEIALRGLVKDAVGRIRANVEDQHFDRADAVFDLLVQGQHLLFTACVRAKGVRLAAIKANALGQTLQLVRMAARDADGIALAREAPRYGAASGVARADHQGDGFQGMRTQVWVRPMPKTEPRTSSFLPSSMGVRRKV